MCLKYTIIIFDSDFPLNGYPASCNKAVTGLHLLDVACGKPARRRYCMQHAGNPRDGATACSMRETRETALLHVACGKPARRRYCM